jgi:hypothetical protein
MTIGFYQDGLKQQAFVRLGLGSPLLLLVELDLVPVIRSAIANARAHADSRRVAWEAL